MLIKTKSGQNAVVATTKNTDGSLSVVATVGGEAYESHITIGAVDQPLPASYGQAEFDADLDRARVFAAEMAESAARKKLLVAGVA